MLWIALAIAASIAAGVEAERRAGARAGVWARGIPKGLLYAVMPVRPRRACSSFRRR